MNTDLIKELIYFITGIKDENTLLFVVTQIKNNITETDDITIESLREIIFVFFSITAENINLNNISIMTDNIIFFYGLYKNNIDIVRQIIEKNTLDETITYANRTPLYFAVKSNNYELCKLIIICYIKMKMMLLILQIKMKILIY